MSKTTQSKPELSYLPVEKLKRGQYQPRRDFEPESLAELAESIKSSGLIQPIVVRPLPNGLYEIVAGERRWRASQLAGLGTVPCLINAYNDAQTAAVAVIENLQRRDLNPIEEANSLLRLVEEFDYSHEELGSIIGKSRTKITNTLRLLRLDDRVQQLLIDKKLSEAHGKVLAGLPQHLQHEVAQQAVNKGWSVRRIEDEARRLNEHSSSAENSSDANIMYLERKTSEHLGAQVKFDADDNNKSGWMKIRYFDLETLGSVLDRLGVKYEE